MVVDLTLVDEERGFDAEATRCLTDVIADDLNTPGDETIRERARKTVANLVTEHPIYA